MHYNSFQVEQLHICSILLHVDNIIAVVMVILYNSLQPPPFFGTPTSSHPPFHASTPLPASATYTTGIGFSDNALSYIYNETYPYLSIRYKCFIDSVGS